MTTGELAAALHGEGTPEAVELAMKLERYSQGTQVVNAPRGDAAAAKKFKGCHLDKRGRCVLK